MLRPAQMKDAGTILTIATGLVSDYPLRPDRDKMRGLIATSISSPADFVWVDEVDGRIRAVLLAVVGDNVWAQRKFADIMLWWSDLPGSGVKLLRRFRDWVYGRNAIKIAGHAPGTELNDRTYAIFEHLGFVRHGGSYLWVRGYGTIQ